MNLFGLLLVDGSRRVVDLLQRSHNRSCLAAIETLNPSVNGRAWEPCCHRWSRLPAPRTAPFRSDGPTPQFLLMLSILSASTRAVHPVQHARRRRPIENVETAEKCEVAAERVLNPRTQFNMSGGARHMVPHK